jgi:nucleoside-diphosphate-sugar epimerase
MKVVVFGGNGYVGSSIIKQLVSLSSSSSIKLTDIISISRSGIPLNKSMIVTSNEININYYKADIFDYKKWIDIASTSTSFISTLGAFGNNEFMEKINGDANILACSKALELKVPRFVYVSTVENNLPPSILRGYFNGKKRAEQAIEDAFPENSFILKPGFIYGSRYVPSPSGKGTMTIPLHLLGKPIETILKLSPFDKLKYLPYMRAIFETPISVDCVGRVAAGSALGLISNNDRYLTVDKMIIESNRLQKL